MIGPLLAALAFLTRLPVPASVHTNEAHLRRSTRWFPLVGFLLGGILAGVAWLTAQRLPSLVAAVLVLTIGALLTGALHLDGLADMADGFGGGRGREDVLRIMRDHAIGSYGAIALVLMLLLKAACLSSLLRTQRGLLAIMLVPGLARWSIVFLSRLLPYARMNETGSPGAGSLCQHVSRFDLIFATACCAILSFFFGALQTLACWAATLVVSVCVAVVCARRIGGVTGDTLGANVVVSEAVQYVVALLLSPR